MSEQTSQEPTMEEILASIRRIISEDDAPADGAAPEAEPEAEPAQAAAPAFEPEPEPEAEDDDGALELTERVETLGDLDVYTPTVNEEPEPAYAPSPPPAAPVEVGEGLVGAVAANAAATAPGSRIQPKWPACPPVASRPMCSIRTGPPRRSTSACSEASGA